MALLRGNSSSFHLLLPRITRIFKTPQKPTCQTVRACTNSTQTPSSASPSVQRWRPICLYHTHGKCTKMDDPAHLQTFNHDFCTHFLDNPADFEGKRPSPQDFDFFLVLDLEGKVEILEFPVLMIDSKSMATVDLFHRFVRPSAMSEERINEYIMNKYGKFGVDRVWHDTALPFNEVIQQFESWLAQHHLWEKKHDGKLNRAAFVTCGNWDVKTQVPHQCKVSKMKLPPYFMEWINLKDVFHNFYHPKREAKGMRTVMEQLKLPMQGSHHLGIDDTQNIARVLVRMLADGAILAITAWRNPVSPRNVSFLYRNRIV